MTELFMCSGFTSLLPRLLWPWLIVLNLQLLLIIAYQGDNQAIGLLVVGFVTAYASFTVSTAKAIDLVQISVPPVVHYGEPFKIRWFFSTGDTRDYIGIYDSNEKRVVMNILTILREHGK